MNGIIDIHAHIFPGKIAEKAVSSIGRYYGVEMSRKGTVEDLLESGGRINVRKYVVHSSATVVEQVRPINDFIAEMQSAHPELIGFATLHPGLGNVSAEVDRIIGLGLKGIKLHPEFQHFSIDDDDMMPIYEAVEGRLPVLMHMGDENVDSSSPARLSGFSPGFPASSSLRRISGDTGCGIFHANTSLAGMSTWILQAHWLSSARIMLRT